MNMLIMDPNMNMIIIHTNEYASYADEYANYTY